MVYPYTDEPAFRVVPAGAGRSASDVDLMVIGSATLRQLAPRLRAAAEQLGRAINPVTMTASEFARGRNKNAFLVDVMAKEKLFFKGTSDELARLGCGWLAEKANYPANIRMQDAANLSDAELGALFRRLFPFGFAGADVLAEIAPEGWDRSPLIRAFHPTLEQWHEERVAQHRHFEKLERSWGRQKKNVAKAKPPRSEPTLEDSRREFKDEPVDVQRECSQILGAVSWEIFAENHLVVAADGREVDLGSWRAASAFLSEFADGQDASRRWDRGDEMRFYMGLGWIRDRCDYGAVYRLVFRRMRHEGLDWSYTFPRLYAFRFNRDESPEPRPHNYSPSDAFAREQQHAANDAEHARLKAELDAAEQQARTEARNSPPPPVVQAYRDICGRWPDGWPP